MVMWNVWVKYKVETSHNDKPFNRFLLKAILYKIMRNYSADSYHRLRLLYE